MGSRLLTKANEVYSQSIKDNEVYSQSIKANEVSRDNFFLIIQTGSLLDSNNQQHMTLESIFKNY